jgi:methanogenic corrinoid protein MtbC1
MNTSNQKTAFVIYSKRDLIAEEIVSRQYKSDSKTWAAYGNIGRQKSVRDAGYHLDYLIEAINASDNNLFLNYIKWVKVLFANLNFSDQVITTTLHYTREVFQEELSLEHFQVAAKYLDEGVRQLLEPTEIPISFIQSGQQTSELAQEYLDILLRSDRSTASRIILDAVKMGIGVKEIYLGIFEPVQREVGRLWQTHRISVAQEHYCSASTQFIMSQLYPYIFTSKKNGRCLVATSVGKELHEIGIRMVADFFEMDGWDTIYLGANMPMEGIIQAIKEQKTDVLALSTTMTFHLSQIAELIIQIRLSAPDTKILVGGYPFNSSPMLWQHFGADGYGGNAEQAIEVANRLISVIN